MYYCQRCKEACTKMQVLLQLQEKLKAYVNSHGSGQYTFVAAGSTPKMAIMYTKMLGNKNKVTNSVSCWSFTNETMPQILKKVYQSCGEACFHHPVFEEEP